LIKGNPSKRPINKNEPQPEIEPACPAVPAFLAGYAADEWLVVGPHLYRLGLLTTLDISSFAAYCDAYGRWRLAREALERMTEQDPVTHGALVRSAAGGVRRNPLARAAEAAAEEMLAWGSMFGLSPASRARIGGGWEPPRPSKFDGLLGPRR
jgi:P27 family predicted phage terminase small subunit